MSNIALVVPGLEEGGGVPAVAEFLCRVIEATGRHEVSLVSLSMRSKDPLSVALLSPASWFRGVLTETSTWRGRPFVRVGSFLSEVEWNRYQSRGAVDRLLESADVIQLVCGSPAWTAVARHFVGRVPVLVQVATTVHVERQRGGRVQSPYRKAMTEAVSRLERSAAGLADVAFVENRDMTEWYRIHAPKTEVIFAPPGLDTRHFSPGSYDPHGPILCVGRLGDRRKNVKLLFTAYAMLRAQLENPPRLHLAGLSGPPPAELAYADELGIRPFVDLTIAPSADELAQIYRRAALFVLSSDEEGLGIVLLEAMASGLPVVATRCGGPETMVEDGGNGLLVPTGDAPAMAAAMKRLLEDAELNGRLRERARIDIDGHYSMAAAGQRFTDVYDRYKRRVT